MMIYPRVFKIFSLSSLFFLFVFGSGVAIATPDLLECDQFYLVSNSSDRCQTTDCMCRAQPGPRPQNPQVIQEFNRRYSIYFQSAIHEASSSQSGAAQEHLDRLHEAHPSASATVIAYTDACGSIEYNTALARRRLETAIQEVGSRFRITSTLIHPEASTQCPFPESRRVDIIVHTERRLTTAIDKIPADVYLIDASGSMWPEWRRWTDIINASYKPGSRIYVSMTRGCRRNQRINDIRPGGGTEIWYAYWRVLDFMQPGETLVIVSDFQSDIPLTSAEHRIIREKVTDRGVNVIAIRP